MNAPISQDLLARLLASRCCCSKVVAVDLKSDMLRHASSFRGILHHVLPSHKSVPLLLKQTCTSRPRWLPAQIKMQSNARSHIWNCRP